MNGSFGSLKIFTVWLNSSMPFTVAAEIIGPVAASAAFAGGTHLDIEDEKEKKDRE